MMTGRRDTPPPGTPYRDVIARSRYMLDSMTPAQMREALETLIISAPDRAIDAITHSLEEDQDEQDQI